MREILGRKLSRADGGDRVRVVRGLLRRAARADDWADLVVTCSALTPTAGHGGDAGLAEMERVCRPGGTVVIVWPNHLDWLASHGYRYVSFEGEMFVEFASHAEAVELDLDLLSGRGRRRCVASAEAGSRTSCWESTRRATSRSRPSPDEDRRRRAARRGDPRASARRLPGLRRRPRARTARQGPRGAPLCRRPDRRCRAFR